MSSSELVLTGKYRDNGANLTCRAENARMTNTALAVRETHVQLNVQCKIESGGAKIKLSKVLTFAFSNVLFKFSQFFFNNNVYTGLRLRAVLIWKLLQDLLL